MLQTNKEKTTTWFQCIATVRRPLDRGPSQVKTCLVAGACVLTLWEMET